MLLLSRTMWLISVMCVKSTAASTLSSLFVQNETGQSRSQIESQSQSRTLTQFGNLWRTAVNKKQFGPRTIQDGRPGPHWHSVSLSVSQAGSQLVEFGWCSFWWWFRSWPLDYIDIPRSMRAAVAIGHWGSLILRLHSWPLTIDVLKPAHTRTYCYKKIFIYMAIYGRTARPWLWLWLSGDPGIWATLSKKCCRGRAAMLC